MGSLKPGATYIYESPDGGQSVYARESGSKERKLIGESLSANTNRKLMQESQLWHDIKVASRTNPTLQEALDRVIIIYNLSKSNE
jgi:hypothetical protein